jgi:hypothetical protein
MRLWCWPRDGAAATLSSSSSVAPGYGTGHEGGSVYFFLAWSVVPDRRGRVIDLPPLSLPSSSPPHSYYSFADITLTETLLQNCSTKIYRMLVRPTNLTFEQSSASARLAFAPVPVVLFPQWSFTRSLCQHLTSEITCLSLFIC